MPNVSQAAEYYFRQIRSQPAYGYGELPLAYYPQSQWYYSPAGPLTGPYQQPSPEYYQPPVGQFYQPVTVQYYPTSVQEFYPQAMSQYLQQAAAQYYQLAVPQYYQHGMQQYYQQPRMSPALGWGASPWSATYGYSMPYGYAYW